jgi:ADP-heptose:LPS heptosyltransferase
MTTAPIQPGGHTLVARLDSDGDVLLAGPALRAVARGSDRLTLLVSPAGEQAARLLPEVDDVLVWSCPWSGFDPPPVDADDVQRLLTTLQKARPDRAVVMTSYHQSSLPLALLLRLAGVGTIVATSEDYPGSLLDVRHPPGGPHEVQRGLSLVAAAGFRSTDDGRLRLRMPLLDPPAALRTWRWAGRFVAVHSTASVPARTPTPSHVGRIVAALRRAGHAVVLTGTQDDAGTTAEVAAVAQQLVDERGAAPLLDLTGSTTFPELAAVLERADCLVSGNTGPGHLAAAVGTPVVSLFAPVVSAEAWQPWGVPCVVLGDQDAPCAATRARSCPVPGHPCLDGIAPEAVVEAVRQLSRGPAPDQCVDGCSENGVITTLPLHSRPHPPTTGTAHRTPEPLGPEGVPA